MGRILSTVTRDVAPDFKIPIVRLGPGELSQSDDIRQLLPVVLDSPYNKYRKLYKLRFSRGNYFTVAQSIHMIPSHEPTLVLLQRLAGPDRDDQIRRLQQLEHPHLLLCKEIFWFDRAPLVTFEFMPLSLAELAGNLLINGFALAAIIGQQWLTSTWVLEGLSYLRKNNLEHGHLSADKILIDATGRVKLCGYELSQRSSNPGRDIKALGRIVRQLMQRHVNENVAEGIHDLDHWPRDCDAVHFLSLTAHETEIRNLQNHALLRRGWNQSHLKGVVSFASICPDQAFKIFCLD
ncbi:hypothetical protein EV126DRAFT_379295 [Verticillium dahliae]|nr:hypothetical protein EV126DRAFT_379295 [Verticillium dahliae]